MKHTLSVLVENKPGVLTRIAGLFARRNFNIDSLAVGETEDPRYSRMTITVDGQAQPIEQVTKQLHKLVNVLKINDLDPATTLQRELVLMKVAADSSSRAEVMQLAGIFRAKVIDVSPQSVVVEVTGDTGKVEALTRVLQPFGIIELVRTGKIAISRGKQPT
jgi:acetolactate synthase-1/3 small subunit